ncbi:MAG: hypothetical protein WC045_04285 [Patescibacteria group bacterium]
MLNFQQKQIRLFAVLVILSIVATTITHYLPKIKSQAVPPETLSSIQQWGTDGSVLVTKIDTTGNIYFGGSFTEINRNTGSAATVDATTGIATGSAFRANAAVNAIIPDGDGGWYIGGGFSKVGDISRSKVAHILSNNTVDPNFSVEASSTVYALYKDGNTLYVGGNFGQLGGQVRFGFGAIDLSANQVSSWSAGVINGVTRTITASSDTVYIGGDFTSAGGQTRNHIAAFAKADATLASFNPNVDDIVYALAYDNSVLYAGGSFLQVGVTLRNYLVAINPTTGVATSWNPDPDYVVYALLPSTSTIFVGGYFDTWSAGSVTRHSLAEVDKTTGATTAFVGTNYTSSTKVLALSKNNNTLYAGGNFTTGSRNYIAAHDATTGTTLSFDPNATAEVRAVAYQNNKVGFAGSFTGINRTARNRAAAISSDGGLLAWNPNLDGNVEDLAIDNGKVFMGGSFTTVGGQSRPGFAGVSTEGLLLTPLMSLDSTVYSVEISGGYVYLGGAFTTILSQTRNRAASLNISDYTLTDWNPNLSGTVWALKSYGSDIYIGGSFTQAGGQSHKGIVKTDRLTGALDLWDANITNGSVFDLEVFNNKLYAGGSFNDIAGTSHVALASYSLPALTLDGWDPGVSNSVYAMVAGTDALYIGGAFTTIQGQARGHVAALTGDRQLAAWNPNADGNVYRLTVHPKLDRVLIGGNFTYLQGGDTPATDLAEFGVAVENTGGGSAPSLENPPVTDSGVLNYLPEFGGKMDIQIAGTNTKAHLEVPDQALGDNVKFTFTTNEEFTQPVNGRVVGVPFQLNVTQGLIRVDEASKVISVTVPYDVTHIPEGSREQDLMLYAYNQSTGIWSPFLDTIIDMSAHTLSVSTTSLSALRQFAVVVPKKEVETTPIPMSESGVPATVSTQRRFKPELPTSGYRVPEKKVEGLELPTL